MQKNHVCFAAVIVAAICLETGCASCPREGKRSGPREARVSSWGFDAKDSTRFLQAAIDSRVPRLIVDKMPSPWITDKLRGVSDQEIVFEKGVEVQAKPGAFRGRSEALLTLRCVTNVTLTGYGATLRMRRAEYDAAPYTHAEWRHALSILSSKNIEVRGLTLAESGGDGIYIGCVDSTLPDTDIRIRDVVCDRNYRQGISVIAADGLLIERAVMRGTAGTPPAAGIDFEPNSPGERITQCVMRDCLTENNAGNGFEFYLAQLDNTSAPIDITLQNCRSSGDHESLSFYAANKKGNGTVKGKLRVSDCTFANARSNGIVLRRVATDGMGVEFSGCVVSNAAALVTNGSDIVISADRHDEKSVGGISFGDLAVYQPSARNWLTYAAGGHCASLEKVSGKVSVFFSDGHITRIKLTDDWIAKTFPHRIFPRVPHVPPDFAAMTVPDSVPGILQKYSQPAWIRKSGRYLFYADKARTITFAARQRQIGKYAAGKKALKIVSLDGKGVKTLALPPMGIATNYSFHVPAKGFYAMDVDVGWNAFAVLAADAPVAMDLTRGPQSFISSESTLSLIVPEGTKQFAVGINGGGGAEKVGVEIFSRNGKSAGRQAAIGEWEQVTLDSKTKSGLWSCRTFPPAEGVFEDFDVEIFGVPALFFLGR